MLEYDFLKLIDSLYIKPYQHFPLPALICDQDLQVYWSNTAAKNLYPALTTPTGLSDLLEEYPTSQLLLDMEREGSCVLSDVLPLNDTHMSMQPIYVQGNIAGAVVLLFTGETVPSPRHVFQSSHTAHALGSGVRQIVSNLFQAMDTAALKADMVGQSWIKSYFQYLGVQSYHILRIVSNVSIYSQLQSGERIPRISLLDLHLFLQDFQAVVEETGKSMDVPVVLHTGKRPCLVGVDQELLEVALFNLLHNSLYFTRPGNHVTLTLTQDDSHATLTIEDAGRGIDPARIPLLWRPYATWSSRENETGIGLGLTLVRRFATLHGGKAELTSQLGVGTTVTLTIPLASGNTPLSLRQVDKPSLGDRFANVYTWLADAADSPFREKRDDDE